MRSAAQEYYEVLSSLLKSVRVTQKDGRELNLYEGIEQAGKMILEQSKRGSKLIFIGNGASAAISSHMALDFQKTGGPRMGVFE